MADNNGNHLPDLPTRHDFPEVKDKIVELVELSAEPDYYGISIRFQDRTALTFAIEPCVVAFPVFSDWTSGEEHQLKQLPTDTQQDSESVTAQDSLGNPPCRISAGFRQVPADDPPEDWRVFYSGKHSGGSPY